jgi:hypothetical protein
VQNGFYSKDPLTLAGAYKPPGKKHGELVTPLDERFAFNSKDTFQRGTNVFLKENLLYEPNKNLDSGDSTLNQSSPIEYQMSPEKPAEAPRFEEQYPPRNVLSIKLADPGESSPEGEDKKSRDDTRLKPRGDTFVNQSNNALMDEECRRDMMPAVEVGGMDMEEEARRDSPQKSVRFTEEAAHSSGKKRRRRVSPGVESSPGGGTSEEYYDEEEEGSDDGLIDQNLQEKLDKIKQNLKGDNTTINGISQIPNTLDVSGGDDSSLIQRERTLKNMEDVLRR